MRVFYCLLLLAGCTAAPKPLPKPARAPQQPLAAAQAPLPAVQAAPAPFSLTLAWDPVTAGPAVDGYAVYYGPASKYYTNRVDAGSVTKATLPNVPRSLSYYVVRSYTANGLESEPSNEIALPVPVTNVYTVSVLIETSTDGIAWAGFTNLPALSLTNPGDAQLLFRANMTITNSVQ